MSNLYVISCIKKFSVTDLEELSFIDYQHFSLSELEILFEKISLTIEELEELNHYLNYDSEFYLNNEDTIYNLEQVQYDVQNTIDFKEYL